MVRRSRFEKKICALHVLATFESLPITTLLSFTGTSYNDKDIIITPMITNNLIEKVDGMVTAYRRKGVRYRLTVDGRRLLQEVERVYDIVGEKRVWEIA